MELATANPNLALMADQQAIKYLAQLNLNDILGRVFRSEFLFAGLSGLDR